MACLNNSGYRRLCYYDDYHNTCSDQPKPMSYKCVGKGTGGSTSQCVKVHEPVGNGTFSTMTECSTHCGTKLPHLQTSYACVNKSYGSGGGQKMCVRQNSPPGPGSYKKLSDCIKKCGPVQTSLKTYYTCENKGLGHSSPTCVVNLGSGGPGTYHSHDSCMSSCGSN